MEAMARQNIKKIKEAMKMKMGDSAIQEIE